MPLCYISVEERGKSSDAKQVIFCFRAIGYVFRII